MLRQKFGLTKKEIGELTPYEVRTQYLVSYETDDTEVDYKKLKAANDLVDQIMARGFTYQEAIEKMKTMKLPPKKKTAGGPAKRTNKMKMNSITSPVMKPAKRRKTT